MAETAPDYAAAAKAARVFLRGAESVGVVADALDQVASLDGALRERRKALTELDSQTAVAQKALRDAKEERAAARDEARALLEEARARAKATMDAATGEAAAIAREAEALRQRATDEALAAARQRDEHAQKVKDLDQQVQSLRIQLQAEEARIAALTQAAAAFAAPAAPKG